jgi:hypothetical protein
LKKFFDKLWVFLGVVFMLFPIASISQSSASVPIINITSPKEGESVNVTIEVEGIMNGKLPDDHYLWILVNPYSAFAQWWPQGGYHIQPDERWFGIALIGRNINEGGEADIGEKFDIAVVMVDSIIDQNLIEWSRKGDETGNFPSIRFPEGGKIMDKVTVIRR